MIFVTVGTHEQPFDRLIKYVDNLKKEKIVNEDIIIQTGFSTYEPQNCIWHKWFPYEEMMEYIANAHIAITHGGPSSFIMSLQNNKIPIVVPRQKKFHEHVNDHQVTFCDAVAARQNNIIVVKNINHLKSIIINYDSIVKSITVMKKGNNIKFNNDLELLVNNLFKKNRI